MPRRFCRKRRKEARRDFSWRRARGSARTPPEAARRSPRAFTPRPRPKNTGNTCGPSCARRSAHTVLRSTSPRCFRTRSTRRGSSASAGCRTARPGRRRKRRRACSCSKTCRTRPTWGRSCAPPKRSACCTSRWSAPAATCTARRCCAAAWARCFGSVWSGTLRRPRAPKRSAGADSRRWRLCRTRRPCPSRRSRLTRAGGPSGSATRETA